jgi:putative ABC transport system permease protein
MVSGRGMLLVRWSLRDLRGRWVLVAAIALLIALGTGLYTGLGSMEAWRLASNDASFAALRVHDVRVALPEGGYLARGRLEEAVRSTAAGADVATAEERLLAPTQVEVATPSGPALVPGKVVGVDTGAGGPEVDAIQASAGRGLGEPDGVGEAVMLDTGFAEERGLPPEGVVTVGGRKVPYVGHARTPEQFVLTEGEGGGLTLPGGFAFVYAPLPLAGELTGHPGQVNDLVLRVTPGADPADVAARLDDELPGVLPGRGATVSVTTDIPAHRLLYRDAVGDQELMDIFAWLVLAGAALAAFNLISRVVDSQRREIGISMALGVPETRVALRPLLLGAEIAVLGVLLGAAVGFVVQELLRDVLVSLSSTMPVVVTPFQPQVWVRGVLVGLLVVLAATLYPVWRGVRVPPIEAIRVSARSASRAGAVRLAKRLRLPGGSVNQMPLRGVLRSPRRTLVTAAGLGAVITVVVALLGTWDAFGDLITRSERESVDPAPTRVIATLNGIVPAADAAAAVAGAPGVASAEPWLRVPASASTGGDEVELVLGAPVGDADIWRPRATSGGLPPGEEGVLLSEVAADDLGVGTGDEVVLTHPAATSDGVALASTPVRVAGTHADPFRAFAYMTPEGAEAIGLGGLANSLDALPAPGVAPEAVVRTLVEEPVVATAQPASGPSWWSRSGSACCSRC